MDVRLLRFFIAVYEQKNLTRAADICFVSQPNISNGIKQLEAELGKTLFDRHKRGVGIRPEAHYLYPIARRLVGEMNGLSQIFAESTYKNKVIIGVADSLPQEHKQQFFRKASKLLDTIEWDIQPISRECEMNLLVREWKYAEDLFLPLWKEDYVLCIPDGHHLLGKEIIELSDLSNEPFIHCPPCEAHQQCLSIIQPETGGWNTVANCATKTETLTCLMAGLGITFLPEGFIDGWYGFEVRPYNGPRYFREVGLSYPRKSLRNPAVSELISYFSKNKLNSQNFRSFGNG